VAELDDILAVTRDVLEAHGGLTNALELPEFAAAYESLWRAGRATDLLLDASQLRRNTEHNAGEGSSVWMISRQNGKSFGAIAGDCAACVANPGHIVRYAALTGKSAKAIILPTVAQIFAGAPDDVRPEVREQDGILAFPNGSTLTWAGTDNEQFDRLRGPRAHRITLDESAFYADLERVEAALLPQLITTNGKPLYVSSPPESIAHPFLARYRAAQASNRAQHATVHDNPRLGAVGVARIIRTEAARLGLSEVELVKSTFWRREYLAEVVTEETRAAVPAWTQEVATAQVRAVERPPFYDAYVGIDLGYSPDPSAALLAWHDPASNSLVIENEVEHRAGTAASFTAALKALEIESWGVDKYEGTLAALADDIAELPEFLQRKVHSKAPKQPFLRVGDNDLQMLAEMATTHGYAVLPTRKDDKALAVDFLNQLVGARRIVIHPRCVRLREQLFSTVWNKSRSEWERTAKDHGDLIDCLVYLARNVRWHRDVRPKAPVIPWGNAPTANPVGWAGAFRKAK
jgi:hypothetical protein